MQTKKVFFLFIEVISNEIEQGADETVRATGKQVAKTYGHLEHKIA